MLSPKKLLVTFVTLCLCSKDVYAKMTECVSGPSNLSDDKFIRVN